MFEFRLPDLGEGIHEGQVVNVLVKEGQTLAEYQPMFEVETDKAAVEIPAPKAGVVAKINVEAGQTVKVGEVMLTIDDSGAPGHTPPPTAEAPAAKPAAVAPAPPAEPVGAPGSEACPEPSRRVRRYVVEGPAPAAPAVRKLARELGVDINVVPASGPHGRVLQEDVEAFAKGVRAGGAVAAGGAPAGRTELLLPPEELPDFSQHGPIRREPVPQIRKTIARQMARSWLNVPRVTHCDVADVSELDRNRKLFNEGLKTGQARLTMTAIVLKAVAAALRDFPQLNASYDPTSAEIIYKDYIHIGLAVDTPRGLVVPVVRDVDKKTLPQLAVELSGLAERTRKGQFEIAELRGATFTITNVGALGGTFVTPMVNFPEAAILGLGQARLQPVVYNGQIAPRLVLPLSLSFDHRIVDGADAARFTTDVIGSLENPLRLISLA